MMGQFTWVETYKQIAARLRTFRENQQELLDFLEDLKAHNIVAISTRDKNDHGETIRLTEIDPFTFFANFNRGIKDETRKEIIRLLIDRWSLSCNVPNDFSGIPVVNNQQSWFIGFKKDRGKADVTLLWDLFEQAIEDRVDEETFNSVLRLKLIRYNITMALFWISPERYLNLDKVNREYLAEKGIQIAGLPDYKTYLQYMDQTRNQFERPFYEISHDAWLQKNPSDPGDEQDAEPTDYWWINANPKMWDLVGHPIGAKQVYKSHNLDGSKRRIYKYFGEVEPGDLVIGYVTAPLQQVVALCRITKGLHKTDEGEAFEFEKVKQFSKPIGYQDLQSVPELKNSEPVKHIHGSLFRLTPEEYQVIRTMLEKEGDVSPPPSGISPYTVEQCAEHTGFAPSQIEQWRSAVERKGQAIFYGPPGTGKTFVAEHLAEHIVGGTDGFVELLQFHPAYAYEEFIQGIRPDTDGNGNLVLSLTPGRLLSFCKKAKQRKGPCVLIIDEINRANLSRVFGELTYLLEYRDRSIPLAGGVPFSIPPNVRIIGTMNTADRSIALVDFALRRRFAFIELSPEYEVLLRFQEKRGFNAEGLVSVLRDVNTKINDKNFSLGISFFMVDDLPEKIEQIWTMEIETYLEEYFFGQPEATRDFTWSAVENRVLS